MTLDVSPSARLPARSLSPHGVHKALKLQQERVGLWCFQHDALDYVGQGIRANTLSPGGVATDEATAVLAGDALLAMAYGLISRHTPTTSLSAERLLALMAEFSDVTSMGGLVNGQYVDILYEGRPCTPEILDSLISLGPAIRIVKGALNEAARVYTELVKSGAGLEYLDVGGGLGVDYDGSQTNFESSVNYTLEEYANDVVYHIQTVCDDAGVKHPTIVSESGRAVVAYHSVLVFNVLGVSGFGGNGGPKLPNPEEVEQPLIDLADTYTNLTTRNALEGYHDAQQALDMALNLFSGGYLPLDQRCQAENLYWAILVKLKKIASTMEDVPEEISGLDDAMADTYFCNFSLFQSCPDSWAIKQLFPVMPIHRLNTPPTQHGVLGDITCDSDGKIDTFIDRRDVKRTLPLHPGLAASWPELLHHVAARPEPGRHGASRLGRLPRLQGEPKAVPA